MPEPIQLPLTLKEAHTLMRAMARANDNILRDELLTKDDRLDIQTVTWLADRIWRLIETNRAGPAS